MNIYLIVCLSQGGKKGKGGGEGLQQWDSEREKVLQALVQLLQLDIRSLWSLSLVEEEFIRYSTDWGHDSFRLSYLNSVSWYHFPLLSPPSIDNIVVFIGSLYEKDLCLSINYVAPNIIRLDELGTVLSCLN